MSNQSIQYTRAFEENINTLLDELKLGIQWDRPSILLAIYKSESIKEKIEQALKSGLEKLEQQVVFIKIGKELPSIFPSLLQTTKKGKTVFFISNIDRGGGEDNRDAYRALNINREFLVENKIRAVFLLSPDEASNLPNYAPDFWAFRHRVIEFIGSHAAPKSILPSGVLIWHAQQDAEEAPAVLKEKIDSREKLLEQLSSDPEALSARGELLYSLGYLYWMLGNSSNASKTLTSGLKLAEKYDLPRQTWLLNGLAVTSYESQKYKDASAIYQKALEMDPTDSFLYLGSAVTSSALGQNLKAVEMGQKAVKVNPSAAHIWNSFGHIYVAIGKPEEAMPCFRKAVELAPGNLRSVLSLAVGYKLTNDLQESLHQLKVAQGTRPRWLEACEKILSGNKPGGMEILRAALRTNQISKTYIERDPNLHLLLDPVEMKTLLT